MKLHTSTVWNSYEMTQSKFAAVFLERFWKAMKHYGRQSYSYRVIPKENSSMISGSLGP